MDTMSKSQMVQRGSWFGFPGMFLMDVPLQGKKKELSPLFSFPLSSFPLKILYHRGQENTFKTQIIRVPSF